MYSLMVSPIPKAFIGFTALIFVFIPKFSFWSYSWEKARLTDAAIIMAPVWQTGLRLRFRDKFTVAQVSMSTNEKAG